RANYIYEDAYGTRKSRYCVSPRVAGTHRETKARKTRTTKLKVFFMKGYLNDLHPIRDPLLIKMKDFARQHRIPIMDDTSIKVLESLIQIKQPKKILEIGSAIGYSAIRMAKACVKSRIISYDID